MRPQTSRRTRRPEASSSFAGDAMTPRRDDVSSASPRPAAKITQKESESDGCGQRNGYIVTTCAGAFFLPPLRIMSASVRSAHLIPSLEWVNADLFLSAETLRHDSRPALRKGLGQRHLVLEPKDIERLSATVEYDGQRAREVIPAVSHHFHNKLIQTRDLF